MKDLLVRLIPRLLPGLREHQHFECLPHEGKSDLDRSIPRKLAAWREPGVRFVVVRDNDNADCLAQKARLSQLCVTAGRSDTLVRLVCQELESWYIGDLKALAAAFGKPKIASEKNRKRFADPDSWQKPSVEVARLVPEFQKRSGARAMAEHLGGQDNLSSSYRVFVAGVERLARSMGYGAEHS